MFSRFLLVSLIGTATVANALANPAEGVYNLVMIEFLTSDCSGDPQGYDFKALDLCKVAYEGWYEKREWDEATLTYTETYYNDSACTVVRDLQPSTESHNCTFDGNDRYTTAMRSDDANASTLYVATYTDSSCSGTPESESWHGGDKCSTEGSTSSMIVIYGRGGGADVNFYSDAKCSTADLNTTASWSFVGGGICTAGDQGKYYKFWAWHPNEPPAGNGSTSETTAGNGSTSEPGAGDGSTTETGVGDGSTTEPAAGDGSTTEPAAGDESADEPEERPTAEGADANPAEGVYNLVREEFLTSDCSGDPQGYGFKALDLCKVAYEGWYEKREWDEATLTYTETYYNDSACTVVRDLQPSTESHNCTFDGNDRYTTAMRSDDANSGTLYLATYTDSSCSGTPESDTFHGGDKCITEGSTSSMIVIYGRGGGADVNFYSDAKCSTADLNTTASWSFVGGGVCTVYPGGNGKYYKFWAWHPNEPAAGNGSTSEPPAGNGSTSEPGAGTGSASEPTAEDGSTTEPAAGDGSTSEPGAGDGSASEPTAGGGSTTEPAAGDGSASEPTAGDGSTTEPAAGDGSASEPTADSGSTTEAPVGDGSTNEPTAESGSTTLISGSVVTVPSVPLMGLLGFAVSLCLWVK